MAELKIAIVVPIFNDWASFNKLVQNIDKSISDEFVNVTIVAVNDASTDDVVINKTLLNDFVTINRIEVVHLNCNLGHQRAIATGLSKVYNDKTSDIVIVMDSDGEDRPEDIPKLISEYKRERDKIIVARRIERSEGILFYINYSIYKFMFRILTGVPISFGNYCLIPTYLLNRLIYQSSIWNHLAATILKSKVLVAMVPTTRGNRYEGGGKMNYRSLILLGISAISVFSEVALLRIIILLLSIIIGLIIIIPASSYYIEYISSECVLSTLYSLIIISALLSIILFGLLLNLVSYRSRMETIPATHYLEYIQKTDIVFNK